MSIKIKIPAYTQTPNIIFDELMKELSPVEFKVLMAIVRKTLGWQKRIDGIGRAQIEEMTGVSRDMVRKSIKSLCERNLIGVIRSKTELGDDAPNQYHLILHDEEERVVEMGGGGGEFNPPGGFFTPPGGLAESLPPHEKGGRGGGFSQAPQKKETQEEEKEREEGDAREARHPPRKRKSPESAKTERAEAVMLTDEQHQKLVTQHGEVVTALLYEKLSVHKLAKNVKYASDYHAIVKWVVRAVQDDQNRSRNADPGRGGTYIPAKNNSRPAPNYDHVPQRVKDKF